MDGQPVVALPALTGALRRALAQEVQAGAIGTRADRLPAPVRKALSLEGRGSFTPFPVSESRC